MTPASARAAKAPRIQARNTLWALVERNGWTIIPLPGLNPADVRAAKRRTIESRLAVKDCVDEYLLGHIKRLDPTVLRAALNRRGVK